MAPKANEAWTMKRGYAAPATEKPASPPPKDAPPTPSPPLRKDDGDGRSK